MLSRKNGDSKILSCPKCCADLIHEKERYYCSNNHSFDIKNQIIVLLSGLPEKKLTMAQQSGSWKITSFLYERIWRPYSLSVITFGKFSVQDEIMELERFLTNIPQHGNVVDLTCSSGFYGRSINSLRPDLTVYFCDYSVVMLNEAQQRSNSDQNFFVAAFAEDSMFCSESVDAFFCGGSWNEITEIERTLFEMYRSLKRGGQFFWMGILKSDSLTGRISQKLAHNLGGLHFETKDSVSASFEQTGFHSIEFRNWKSVFIITGKK